MDLKVFISVRADKSAGPFDGAVCTEGVMTTARPADDWYDKEKVVVGSLGWIHNSSIDSKTKPIGQVQCLKLANRCVIIC